MRALAVGTIGALACLGPFAAPPARAALPSAGSCEADAELIIGGSDWRWVTFGPGETIRTDYGDIDVDGFYERLAAMADD